MKWTYPTGQHLLWTEQSGPENLDPVVWPRAASSAELFWTGPGQNAGAALPRLHDVAYRMRRRGVNAVTILKRPKTLVSNICLKRLGSASIAGASYTGKVVSHVLFR